MLSFNQQIIPQKLFLKVKFELAPFKYKPVLFLGPKHTLLSTCTSRDVIAVQKYTIHVTSLL